MPLREWRQEELVIDHSSIHRLTLPVVTMRFGDRRFRASLMGRSLRGGCRSLRDLLCSELNPCQLLIPITEQILHVRRDF